MALIVVLTGIATFACMLLVPRYYRSNDVVLCEFETSTVYMGLHSVGASMGFDLGSRMENSDAIGPTRYALMINSTTFLKDVMKMKVKTQGGEEMQYYTYLQTHPQYGFWKNLWQSCFGNDEALQKIDDVDPFRLTEAQDRIFQRGREHLVCVYNPNKNSYFVSVLDRDPMVCATLASQVQQYLSLRITEYRVEKNQQEATFYDQQVKQAEERYHKALDEYDAYSDAHLGNTSTRVTAQKEALELLRGQRYQELEAMWLQRMQARSMVQDRTPAFHLLKPAFVPIKSVGPKRLYTAAMMMLLAFLGCIIYYTRHLILEQLKQ